MKREWQFGDWAETSDGRRVRVVYVNGGKGRSIKADGCWLWCSLSSLTYLPDCTSFEWQPPAPIDPGEGWRLLEPNEPPEKGDEFLSYGHWHESTNWEHYGKKSPGCYYRRRLPPPLQLREGGWYERRDGKVVGPCYRREEHKATFPWMVDGRIYTNSGTYWADCNEQNPYDLIREVPAPAVWRPATIDDLKRAPCEARFRDFPFAPWSKPLELVGYRLFADRHFWRCSQGQDWCMCEVLEQGPAE